MSIYLEKKLIDCKILRSGKLKKETVELLNDLKIFPWNPISAELLKIRVLSVSIILKETFNFYDLRVYSLYLELWDTVNTLGKLRVE